MTKEKNHTFPLKLRTSLIITKKIVTINNPFTFLNFTQHLCNLQDIVINHNNRRNTLSSKYTTQVDLVHFHIIGYHFHLD